MIFEFLFVGVLWGGSTPFIKRASKSESCSSSSSGEHSGREKRESSLSWGQFARMLMNWWLVVPFIVDKIGSVMFYFLLGDLPMSLVVPAVNSISFASTAVTEFVLDGQLPNGNVIAGVALVAAGLAVCSTGDQHELT